MYLCVDTNSRPIIKKDGLKLMLLTPSPPLSVIMTLIFKKKCPLSDSRSVHELQLVSCPDYFSRRKRSGHETKLQHEPWLLPLVFQMWCLLQPIFLAQISLNPLTSHTIPALVCCCLLLLLPREVVGSFFALPFGKGKCLEQTRW